MGKIPQGPRKETNRQEEHLGCIWMIQRACPPQRAASSLPHPTVLLLSQQASLVGVGWWAFWTACLAPGQALTSDHVGRLQGSQDWEGVEGDVLLPEPNEAVPPAFHRGAQLGGPLFHQVQRESSPPWCFQGNGLPFALLSFSPPLAQADSTPPNMAPFCLHPPARSVAVDSSVSSLPAILHRTLCFPQVQLRAILPASSSTSFLLE